MDLHMRGHDRVKLGKLLNPAGGMIALTADVAALHGGGILFVLGAGSRPRQLALLVFSATMVALYTVRMM